MQPSQELLMHGEYQQKAPFESTPTEMKLRISKQAEA
jgi:hypothetical protein